MVDRRMVLLDRLSSAASNYADIANKLSTTAGTHSREFHELLRQTRSARAEVDKARAEFEEHHRSGQSPSIIALELGEAP